MSLLQSNYSDLALQESDIADEHHELNSGEDALPPRPNSRLGFNGAAAPPELPVAPVRSPKATLKWTRSLFQKIRIPSFPSPASADVDMDITAVSPSADDDDLDPLSLPVLPSLASAASSTSSLNLTDMDVDTGSSCDDEYDSDSDGYSSGDSDVDPDSSTEGGHNLLLFPPIPTTTPVSRPTQPPSSPLPAVPPAPIVPYAVISSPAPPPPCPRRATPSPLARAKYSSLPSPLSPNSDDRILYTNPHRHVYGHHGRSRYALMHFKYLWALREDQWDEHATRVRDSYAYTGISPSAPPRSSPSPPPRNSHPNLRPIPPLTIHPRRGDLPSLRDPYCAHMDRCFVGMPLWTMGKTLWMYDIHMLTGHRARMAQLLEKAGDGKESEDEDSEGESMAASVSTAGFSDDSDETLVESESEGEREGDGVMEEIDLSDGVEKKGGVVVKGPFRPRSDYLVPKRAAPAFRSSASLPPPQWETSSYKRWEILLELMRIDTERERAQRGPEEPQPEPTVSAARPPRFFIGEDDLDEGDESWGEERWDDMLAGNGHGEDDVMIVSSHPPPILLAARR
ncbi:hypothetical protein DFH06DRAFT_1477785 [Mycena polygramma]|nr:hypothetical protein DFH06DRAFT_1477785 [Mycena polygramma]